MNAAETAVRVPVSNMFNALKNLEQHVLLFAPRDEADPGYLGLVRLLDIYPDESQPGYFWIALGAVKPFDVTLTLEAIYGSKGARPFYRYSHAIRVVPEFELNRLIQIEPQVTSYVVGLGEAEQAHFGMDQLPQRTRSSKIARKTYVRYLVAKHYGRVCPFSGENFVSLDGLRSAIDVGHLRPLGFGGPDHIQNALPMSKVTNWAWDEGIITLENAGEFRISPKATDEIKHYFRRCEEIAFPKDPRAWPKAEYLEWHRDMIFGSTAAQRDSLAEQFRRP